MRTRTACVRPLPARLYLLPTLAAAALLAGCAAAGPDYRRPDLHLPASVAPGADALDPMAVPPVPGTRGTDAPDGVRGTGAPGAAEADARANPPVDAGPPGWWRRFGSPQLDALVARSLREHPTVAAGQAALRQAEAFVRAQQGQFMPQLQAAYSGSRQKVAGVLSSPLSDSSYVFNLHTLQLDLSYTPDVFGANRRAVEGLRAGVVQQQSLLDATRLSLAANVALAAVQEATLRAQMEGLDEQLKLQRELFTRSQALERAGQLGKADLAVQEAALANLEAQRPPLQRALGQGRDLLKQLVGAWPDEVLPQRFELADLHLPAPLPTTLPSTMLARRPDIRAAEAQLQAASAAVGVAAAARLPSITLGVNSYGESGSRIADLFRSANSFWTLAGGITQPLFDGDTLREREAAARAGYAEAEQQYRATVINAFQNVADALIAVQSDGQAVDTAHRAEDAAQRSLAIGEKQHALGDLGAMALAQLRQAWLQARAQRILAEGARLGDAVALYQAAGEDVPGAAGGQAAATDHATAATQP